MANSEGFPAANAEKELNPGQNKDFQVDSVSSDIATSKDLKEKAEAEEKRKEEEARKDTVQTIKTAIMVSGIVVAVAGAIFAITKKFKEK